MLKRASLQCTKNLYKFLNMSQRIQQIEDYYQIQFRKDMQDVKLDALKKWKSQDRIPYSDFQHVESILAQRNSIFSTARLTHARKFIPEAKQSNTLFIIKEAISSGQNNVAISNIAIMRSQEKLIPDLEAELLIEYSRMSWNLKDTNLAKQLLLQIIHDKELKDSLIKSKAYRLQGEYLAQNHAESIDKIHENYFLKSLACYEEFLRKNGKNDLLQSEIASQCGDEDEITVRMRKEMLIYETIAKYADREYIQVVS